MNLVPRRPQWARPILAVLLAVLVGTSWYLFAEWSIAHRWGYSLDDSWIYAVYAKNVATGHGYSFNPGERMAAATGPLYVFILSGLYSLFRDVVIPAKILGILCLAASSLLLMSAVRRLSIDKELPPLIAGVLLALSPPVLWGALGGLEVPVCLFVVCAGLHLYVHERWVWGCLCWALSVWLRPEAILLALLGIAGASTRLSRSQLALTVLGSTAIVGGYLLFNQAVGGWILPSSAKVAAHPGNHFLVSQWAMMKQWADVWLGSIGARRLGLHAVLLLPGIVVGSVLLIRRFPALPAFFILLPISLAVVRPWAGQLDRYLVPMIPFGILLGLIGLEHLCRRLSGARVVALLATGLVCVLWQAYTARKVGIAHGWNVQNINGMQRYIGETTAKATTPGDTIAVNDVGAIGYFSGCYVVDLVGLTSPVRSFPDNLARYRPKYLIIFPDWFQDFGAIDPVTDQVVFYDADSTFKYSPFLGVGLRHNTISSRNTMYLYERLGRNQTGASQPQLIVH
jgi:hypothetical protein